MSRTVLDEPRCSRTCSTAVTGWLRSRDRGDVMQVKPLAIQQTRLAALLVILTSVLVACGHSSRAVSNSSSSAPPNGVVVASFNFPESALLAEIYAQALEHAGVPVR